MFILDLYNEIESLCYKQKHVTWLSYVNYTIHEYYIITSWCFIN